MIPIYFTAIFWNFRKIFTRLMWGRIIVALTFLLILSFLFSALFLLSKSAFLFLHTFKGVSQPIISYILLSALAFSAVLSVFSFAFSLSQRLFERRCAFYFFSSASSISLFQSVFLENFLLGGWPFVILALPLLLAYLTVSQATIGLYFLLFVLFLLLTILTESLGAILAIFLRYFFGRASQKVILVFTLLSFLALALALKQVFLPAGLWEAADKPTLREVFTGLSSLPLAQPWLPTRLFVSSLTQNFSAFLLFILQAVFFYLAALAIAKKYYRRSWQKAQESVFLAAPHQSATFLKRPVSFHGLWLSLFKKDFLLLDRSPSLIIYFSFVAFLALIFLFLLSQSPHSPDFSPALFRKIAALAITIVGYLLTMLCLRFSFPGVLAEFRYFWTFSSLPDARSKVLLVKWLSNTLFAGIVAWIFGLLVVVFLRLSFDFAPFVLGFSLSAAVLISAVNLVIGTLWAPNLPRENVDETTTAFPGVLATLFSVFIAAILGIIFYLLTQSGPDGEIILINRGVSSFILASTLLFSGLFGVSTFLLARQKFILMDIH